MNYKTVYLSLLILLLTCACTAATLSDFLKAVNQVEASGQTGMIWGDNHKALGPFQIHKQYWHDSCVQGSYKQVADYSYGSKVVIAYLKRFCPKALQNNDWETCARVHNGGPGFSRTRTNFYWKKITNHLTN